MTATLKCKVCSLETCDLTPAGFCKDVAACDLRRWQRSPLLNPPKPPAAAIPLRARVWMYVRQRVHFFKRVSTSHASATVCEHCGSMRASGSTVVHEHFELVPDAEEATIFAGEDAEVLRREWGAKVEAL
ncbi:MAG: hypothetical protein ACYCPT_01890 [Acidimicrobiales bacterium]